MSYVVYCENQSIALTLKGINFVFFALIFSLYLSLLLSLAPAASNV